MSDCDPRLVLTSLSSAGDVVEETFSRPPAQPGPEAAGEGTAAAQITGSSAALNRVYLPHLVGPKEKCDPVRI